LQHDAPASVEGQGGEFTLLKIAMTLRDNGISFERGLEVPFARSRFSQDRAEI
jgi:hypothetical protein